MDRFNKVAAPHALGGDPAVTSVMGRAVAKDPEGAARRRFASAPAPDQQALSDRRATDINSPLATGEYLSRTIPNASLTVFPDEGHFIILKRWGEIIRHLANAT